MAVPPWLPTYDITDEDLLAALNTAIARLLTFGKQVQLRGQLVTRENLPALTNFRDELIAKISRKQNGLASTRAVRGR